ncbi:MAG: ATP-binding protein [Eubacterium sp.]|nr:ATP-binding protein [Eubacterium sp.]
MATVRKCFNVSADCKPELHYMVNIEGKLKEIRRMVDRGDYFTINRARQYGKTTVLKALGRYLQQDYVVLSLDFQKLSQQDFESEASFVEALAREIRKKEAFLNSASAQITEQMSALTQGMGVRLSVLFDCLSRWCGECSQSDRGPVVLLIDEVDSAADHVVFLDFLSQLRGYYIDRDETSTFYSVILAGVYDIRQLRRKVRPQEEHTYNSPWNIAADFLVDMSFSEKGIAGMLQEYEQDFQTGMNITNTAKFIYDYTSGYPYLVSRICKITDERIAGSSRWPDRQSAWTKEGLQAAVRVLLGEKNTLFESLVNKLADFQEVRAMIYGLLFEGKELPFHSLNHTLQTAVMFGFIKESNGNAVVSNRIFETILYNLFLSEEALCSSMYQAASLHRSQFVTDGRLDMELVLQKFAEHFIEIYGGQGETFLEDVGRRYFLLYLKPIINGTGNYYIEAQTRNLQRTDVIVDFHGEQFIIELKIWRGSAYHEKGEEQLGCYLDSYGLKKGYLLTFCFQKKKQKKTEIRKRNIGDKTLIEVLV